MLPIKKIMSTRGFLLIARGIKLLYSRTLAIECKVSAVFWQSLLLSWKSGCLGDVRLSEAENFCNFEAKFKNTEQRPLEAIFATVSGSTLHSQGSQ